MFEGLDTYANISINGEFVKATNNSFVKYTIPLANLKKDGQDNTIKIVFSPSQKIDNDQQGKTRLPFAYGHSRKAPYQYGWDWAPEMITVGIWRPVYILGFENARIDYVWARNRLISNEKAVINFATVLHKAAAPAVTPAGEKTAYNISVLLDNVTLGSVSCK